LVFSQIDRFLQRRKNSPFLKLFPKHPKLIDGDIVPGAENLVSLSQPVSDDFDRPLALIGFNGLKYLPADWATSLDHKMPIVIETAMVYALNNAGRGAHRALNLAAFLMSQSPRHE
jgi:hypothetical protein